MAQSIAMRTFLSPALAAPLPGGFVYLRDVDPSILQDMRYATGDNFTGRPLPGYAAPECVLRRAVAQALKKVQADLAKQNLSLKVYDCYRPQRAVSAFARWAREPNSGATRRFYPRLAKRALFAQGYISGTSRHSDGSAVDLTLVQLPSALPSSPRKRGSSSSLDERAGSSAGACHRAALCADPLADDDRVKGFRGDDRKVDAPCTAPASQRAPDNSLDMGTGFDCFDAKSHTASSVTPEQRRNRDTLLAAMRRHGFHNYPLEWWHFGFGARGERRDFVIEPR
jgi:D-alanyl-D-alanine dipeptidase